jgi:hypothetical protein
MTSSQFYDDYEKVVKNRAYSYKKEGDIVKKSKLSFSTVGATSLFTTVRDLCKWAIHLNTLSESNEQLSKRMNTRAKLNNGKLTEAAMGQWTGVKFHGLEWFDHSGSDASYRAYLSRFPESNSAVVYLGNVVPPEAGASDYALAVADPFLKEFYVENAESDSKKKLTSKEDFNGIELSQEILEQFCGKYWEPEERYNREIILKDGKLIYYRSESSQTELLPVGKNEFKMLADPNDVSVFFEKDDQNISTMRLNINDERTVHFVKYDQDFQTNIYTGTYHCPELKSTLTITLKNTKLVASLFKQNEVELTPVNKDLFKSSDRNLSKIKFVRDKKGHLSSLKLSNGGAVNVKYFKEK